MSRYLLLVILNAPFILAAMLNTIVIYKMKRISARILTIRLLFWFIILVGLTLTKPIYVYLFSNKLTATEPLSLFDVVEITAIVIILFVLTRYREKLSRLELTVKEMHQELSIRLSDQKSKKP